MFHLCCFFGAPTPKNKKMKMKKKKRKRRRRRKENGRTPLGRVNSIVNSIDKKRNNKSRRKNSFISPEVALQLLFTLNR